MLSVVTVNGHLYAEGRELIQQVLLFALLMGQLEVVLMDGLLYGMDNEIGLFHGESSHDESINVCIITLACNG